MLLHILTYRTDVRMNLFFTGLVNEEGKKMSLKILQHFCFECF